MPYIKKIELKGFKTFGQTTTILLEKGFTVITGPNGSGKTNIIDAVLFVLGELSSRRLRAENFSKLIFHGSPEAKLDNVKMAKVVMQFNNSDGLIPLDTSTVTVSREVYKNGQSVYRLNGRRMSRANVVDTLAMAGISGTGHNVVLQGTVTRMAEVSPFERRKILEDLVGIAQYDAEKAEAEEKLRVADISIKTAMGKVEEVQKRVDDLERERNQLLRYNFIQNEIKRFEATKISHEIEEIQIKTNELSSRIEEASSKVEKLRHLRDEFRGERHQAEIEWRKLSTEKVEEGSTRVLEVQIKIGEIKGKITELVTKINAVTTSLEALKKTKENDLQQLQATKKSMVETRALIRQKKKEHNHLTKEINLKHLQHEALAAETTKLWSNLDENSKRIREIEQQLDKLYQDLVKFRSEYTESQTKIQILTRRLEDPNAQRERLTSTLNQLQKSLNDLYTVQEEQKTRLKSLQQTLDRRRMQKEAIAREIIEAGKIADSAREAVVEFVTQRQLAETVASEKMALRNIEDMGKLGIIPGVFGRLRNLLKIDKEYEQTIEATAAGWLDAIVVQDFKTALTCTETLRRLKLGRIKIIPIKELINIKPVNYSKIEGVNETASNRVRCSKRFESAVNFVLGDTLIAKDDATALKACREGYRVVTVNGDLYETGGAIESGYYRAPIDFASLIPREIAVKSLDEAVQMLQEHLKKRGSDITTFEDEINKTSVEIAKLTEVIATLESEINRIKRNIRATNRNVKHVELKIRNFHDRIQKEKALMEAKRAQRNTMLKETQKLRSELATLRRKVDLSHIQELEVPRGKLGEQLVELRQKLSVVEIDFKTSQAKLEDILKTSSDNIKSQLEKIDQQLVKLRDEIESAFKEKNMLESELSKLETSKEELSRLVLTSRKESVKFTNQIDDVDKQLQKVDEEYARADALLNQLQLNFQTSQMLLDQNRSRLKEIGYEEFTVSREQLEAAESSLKLMRFELERLGAVNQLALIHHAEQIARYKELSIRINELEKEKQSIIAFMDEIELKKIRVFMEAFKKIDSNFSKHFLKLTGGGEASLKLENVENPFLGGTDMVVQFPGKPPILVSGASSGERSVAAVAFLFSIQNFMPTSFYIFDEVDAHLDPFHVAKLGELLAEESAYSQFVVITLKPEMANKAERIYGVYEQKGVSHVISVKFKEAYT
jgi:chromosome segregation protein